MSSGSGASRFKIAPSILSADFGRLADEVAKAEAAGADWIHIDVMDGHFVPNMTIGPPVVEAVKRAATVPLDVHLMIEDPGRWIDAYAGAGADRLGVHVEACAHLHRVLESVRARDVAASVVLNPATPAAAVREVLGVVDQVLVMTVNPGFGGQKFISAVMPKLARLRRDIDAAGLDVELEVDGGINLDTVETAALHGARVFVIGAAFFEHANPGPFVDKVRALLAPYDRDPDASPGP